MRAGNYYYVVTANVGSTESSNSIVLTGVPTFLPPPWLNADIGAVSANGGAYADTSGDIYGHQFGHDDQW